MSIPKLEAAERMRALPDDVREDAIRSSPNVFDMRERSVLNKAENDRKRRQIEVAEQYRVSKAPPPGGVA